MSSLLQHTRPSRDQLHVIQGTLALVADISRAGIDAGLVVPDRGRPLEKGGVDQTTTALRAEDVFMNARQIPPGVGFFAEVCQQLGGIGGCRERTRHLGWAGGAWWCREGEGRGSVALRHG